MGKTIDIRTDVPTDWITVAAAEERHQRMGELFRQLGFVQTRQVNGVLIDKRGKPFMQIQREKSHEVAVSHVEALRRPGPILILEDDVWPTAAFAPVLQDIPDDADAVYLGSSIYGMVDGVSTEGGTRFEAVDPQWDRPLNMLGIHAVLYLTERYKRATVANLLAARDRGMYCDEPVAIEMRNHRVYATARPMLYQRDGHNDQVTSMPLRMLRPEVVVPAARARAPSTGGWASCVPGGMADPARPRATTFL
ncbi:MAG: hypothetical protein AAGA56_17290 [Myxococcota bacterium]